MVLGLCLVGAFGAPAKASPDASLLKQTLSRAAAVELPAQSADLVTKAKPADREATTIAVVKTAIGLRPAAAPAIVGAIAKAAPDMAATAVVTAVGLEPKLAQAIAKAAFPRASAKAIGAKLQTASASAAVLAAAAVENPLASGAKPTAPSGATVPGPSIGPPYVPPGQTPGNVTVYGSYPTPPGYNRVQDYASP